jgi:hypothetical protein
MQGFENYIKNNKEWFDSETLPDNHSVRFEKKLNSKFQHKKSFVIRYSLAIAASVIIFIASSIYIYYIKTEGYKGVIEASQSVEFRETVNFYTVQNEVAMKKLKETLEAQPQNVSSPLLSEFSDMDDSYKQLIKDLKNNPNDVRIMSAIVQYHQLKLDLINNLIERFSLYSNAKNSYHEKGNI